MAKKRTGFLLKIDQKEVIDSLSDEEAGQLLKAIYSYECSEERIIPPMDKLVKVIFLTFKGYLDENKEVYEETCRKNKENIEKRWKKLQEENTTVYDRIPNIPIKGNEMKLNEMKLNEMKGKESDKNNNINNNNKININNSECVNKKESATHDNPPTLNQIISFCQENGMSDFDSEKFFETYESTGWVNANNVKITNWKSLVKKWYKEDLKKKNKEGEDEYAGILRM